MKTLGLFKTALSVGTLIAVACSGDDFSECEESRTCPSEIQGGASGEAGRRADGGEAGGSDTQIGGAGSGGAGPECDSDADCDDAEPKNGVESCATGVCIAGNPPPSVVAVVPDDLELDVEPDGTVLIEFSEAMNAATITTEAVKLIDGEVEVEGTVTYADAAAIFTPAEPLSLLTQYRVVVTTDAADLEGAAMLTEFSATFTVRDGSWSDVDPVENGGVTLGEREPCLVVDGAGNALVVWNEYIGAGSVNQVSVRWYRNGTWADPVPFGTTDAGDINTFSCAVNARGDAVVAWMVTDRISSGVDLYARQYRDGLWEPAELDIDEDWLGGRMKVGMAPTGEAHVIWMSNENLRARTTNTAGAWNSQIRVIGRGFYDVPTLTFDATGDAFAAWRDRNESEQDTIYAARYLASTAVWYPGAPLPDSVANDLGSPALATLGGSGTMAAWVSQSAPPSFSLLASHFSDGTWSSPTPLDTTAVESQEPPGLVAGGNSFFVAWNQVAVSQVAGEVAQVRSARYSAGVWEGSGVAYAAGLELGSRARMPRLAGDAHGNLLLVWAEISEIQTGFTFRYQRYSSLTSTWSEMLRVVEPPMLYAPYRLDVGANGTAMAIWVDHELPDSTPTPLDIFATVFR